MIRTSRLPGLVLALAVSVATPAFADTEFVYSQAGLAQGTNYFQWCLEGEPNCLASQRVLCATPEGGTFQEHSAQYNADGQGNDGYVGWGVFTGPWWDMTAFAGGDLRLFVKLDPPDLNANVKVEIECRPEPATYPAGVSYTAVLPNPPDNNWHEVVIPLVDASFEAFDLSTNPFTPITRPLDAACLSTVSALFKATLENVDLATAFATMSIDFVRWETSNTHTGASNVGIQGRQLMVDGRPFVVNGVAYAPVGIGENWQAAWRDRPDRYNVDFPLIAGMGANTLRLYAPMVTTAMLDAAAAEGLYVIPQFGVDSINLECPLGKTYLEDRFVQMVQQWKDHPAVLAWLVGNEVNLNLTPGVDLCTDFFPTLDSLGRLAHVAEVGGGVCSIARTACMVDADCDPAEICVLEGACSISNATACTGDTDCPGSETCVLPDDFHPVGTAIGGMTDVCPACGDDTDLPNVDFWGTQLYRGCTYGTAFTEYDSKPDCNRPLIVTEYGVDAFHQPEPGPPGSEDQTTHANCLAPALDEGHLELAARTSGGVLAGQTLFEWADEWWKAECLPTTSWTAHDTCASSDNAAFPDGKVHEEWFGIATLVSGTGNKDQRPTRIAYDTIGDLWLGPVCNMQVDAFDRGTGDATISFDVAKGNLDPVLGHDLHYGPLNAVSTYGYTGSIDLGATSPSTITLPAGDLFWIVAGENSMSEDGCHGMDSAGAERPCSTGNCVTGWNCSCSRP